MQEVKILKEGQGAKQPGTRKLGKKEARTRGA
jgi:hypothetical protein